MTRVDLRQATLADEHEFLARAAASRNLHAPWVTAPSTPKKYRQWIERMSPPASYPFLICTSSGEIAGVINLSNIIYGAFRSGYLGYYAFAGFSGQGLMTAGMRAVVRHAFKELKLHRLEANIQPGNTASIALVKRCGFQLEGFSPRYLKIGGRWRDHERWAILARS